MARPWVAAALWVIGGLMVGQSHAALKLVEDGTPASVIVVADKPSKSAEAAAGVLKTFIAKAGGADLPVVKEGALKEPAGALILVGETKRTLALGVEPAKFQLEEIRVQTFPGVLVIVGDDARPDGMALEGTMWAAQTFLDECLGVRLLWPGPLGEVVPARKTIEVGDVSIRHVPPIRKRVIRNIGVNARVEKMLTEKLKWSVDEAKKRHEESHPWFSFHRMGGSFNGSYGHAYGTWWERFSKTHPEWFAQQPNGGRDHSRAEGGKRSQFCVSNADLIAEIAKEKMQELRANPDKDCVSVSPNDGGGVTFCLCPKCEAMDAKEGELVDIYGMKHVSLTDRYVKYYSAIAELVCKEFPDRYLGAYAYSAYRLPPIHAKLHPNVMIGYVGFGYLNEEGRQKARAQWLQWAKAAKTLFLRPNLLTAGQGVPTIYVHRLAEDIRFCHENGMLVTDFDCCYQHWSTDGVNYYVLARLLWNPKADVDAVLEDYCRAGFGPAAGQVREYFRAIEDMTDRLAKSNEYQDRRRTPHGLGSWYTDDLLKKCGALLDDAARKAGDDATVRQRVEFLRVGLDYARIRRDLDLAKATVEAANPKKPAVDLKDDLQDAEARKKAEAAATPKVDAETGRQAAKRAKELQAEMDAFYQKIGFTWALNPPYLKFYGH